MAYIPKGENPTIYIAEILGEDRDYVYRRFRGDTNFTFDEIVILAQKLGFSIDSIAKQNKEASILFETSSKHMKHKEEIYLNKLKISADIISKITHTESLSIKWAGNTVPFEIFTGYENLSRLYFYKLVYQSLEDTSDFKFCDFSISEQGLFLLDKCNLKLSDSSKVIFIIDQNFFSSVINTINYYYRGGLISNLELEILKEELFNFVHCFEQTAASGVFKGGGKVEIYLSYLNIHSSHAYITSKEHRFSQFATFSSNMLSSGNKEICNIYEKWIDNIRKYSTLISYSNEIQRYAFLNEQRKMINHLGNHIQ